MPGTPGGPVRSKDFPEGLPALQGLDRDKVKDGNRLLQISLEIISICRTQGTRVSLENPRSSFLWKQPNMCRAAELGGSCVVFGLLLLWHLLEKPTNFTSWNTTDCKELSETCKVSVKQ